ncbi:MAG: hypothetical protein C0599_13425 [Salinivirgaceae bacterium]|nr:MAG: hypothetical protein C0599_13425 [Salinivirgaceae bacterium]
MIEITQVHASNHIQKIKELDDHLFKIYQQISLRELEIIAQQNGLFAIFHHKQIIAFAELLFESTDFYSLENPQWAFIYGLGVAPSHRNKGLATQMLSFIEKIAVQKNKTALYLATRPDNKEAILLWKKRGFNIYDYKENFFGSTEQKDGRLLFIKELF